MSTTPIGLSIYAMEKAKRERMDVVPPGEGAALQPPLTRPRARVTEEITPEAAAAIAPAPPRHLGAGASLRALQRHGGLIALTALLFVTGMCAYDLALRDLLSRPGVPAWLPRIGAEKRYAAEAAFEHTPGILDLPSGGLAPLPLDMETISRIPERQGFKEALLATLRQACPQEEDARTAEMRDRLLRYLAENGPEQAAAVTILPRSAVTGTVRIVGDHPALLPALAHAAMPALNRYVQNLRLQRLCERERELCLIRAENEQALEAAWQALGVLDASIPAAAAETGVDQEALRLDSFLREGHKLEMDVLRLRIELEQYQEVNHYEQIKARHFIKTEDDLAKVMSKDDPLRSEWAALSDQVDLLKLRYREKHPSIQEIQQKIEAIQAQLARAGSVTSSGQVPPLPSAADREILEHVAALANQVALKERELAVLQQQIEEIQAQERARLAEHRPARDPARRQGESRQHLALRTQIRLGQERAIQCANDLADLALARRRIEQHQEFQPLAGSPAAQLISPHLGSDLFAAALVGLLLGGCAACLRERLDGTLHHAADIPARLGLNSLGTIPAWDETQSRILDPDTPRAPLGAVFGQLCSALLFSRAGNPEQRLLVTSATAGEGKSTTAVNLAIQYVLDGNSVLLIDADLRRPAHARHPLERFATGDRNAPGLAQVLSERAAYADALRDTAIHGLNFIAGGEPPRNPAKLLGMPALAALLARAEEEFDVVILDAPAVLPVVDATVLAPHMRGVLFVVAADEVEQHAAHTALQRLRRVGAPLVGAVINRVRDCAAPAAPVDAEHDPRPRGDASLRRAARHGTLRQAYLDLPLGHRIGTA